jgi:hypothetical protein
MGSYILPLGEFIACGGTDGKVSIWRVPWWDDSKEKVIAHTQLSFHCFSLPLRLQAHKSLLDVRSAQVSFRGHSHWYNCLRSAQPVTLPSHTARDIDRQLDYLEVS